MDKKVIVWILLGTLISGIISYQVTLGLTGTDLSYNNTNTTLTSTTVKGALDEIYALAAKYDTVYSNGTIVYYNPITNTKCTSSDYKTANSNNDYKGTSNTSTQNGCLRWFAYNDRAGQKYVNLLLDHNTTARV